MVLEEGGEAPHRHRVEDGLGRDLSQLAPLLRQQRQPEHLPHEAWVQRIEPVEEDEVAEEEEEEEAPNDSSASRAPPSDTPLPCLRNHILVQNDDERVGVHGAESLGEQAVRVDEEPGELGEERELALRLHEAEALVADDVVLAREPPELGQVQRVRGLPRVPVLRLGPQARRLEDGSTLEEETEVVLIQ